MFGKLETALFTQRARNVVVVGSCLVAHRVGEVVGSPKGQHRLVGRYLVGKLDTSLVAHRAREVVLVSCWLSIVGC